MKELFRVDFDKIEGHLNMEMKKGNVIISAKNKHDNTYLFGSITVKDAREIKEMQEGSLFLKCSCEKQTRIPIGFKEIKDVIFICYDEGTSFYGFILLGQERKLVIELSPEEYKDFQEFLSNFID